MLLHVAPATVHRLPSLHRWGTPHCLAPTHVCTNACIHSVWHTIICTARDVRTHPPQLSPPLLVNHPVMPRGCARPLQGRSQHTAA
jgi:hypothetical protein